MNTYTYTYTYIPKELLHIILDYDGRIKYKNGQYINIIHKHDERYNMLNPLINKKMDANKFEICYYDFRGDNFIQIRTYIT